MILFLPNITSSQVADTTETQRPESPLALAVTVKDELGNINLMSIIAGET